MQLKGRSAIIAGGASGLGYAAAKLLRSRGANVALLDLNEELGRTAADELAASFHRTNVTDEAEVAQALQEAAARNGTANILVNCAGIGSPGLMIGRDGTPMPLDAFVKVIQVNLIGTFNLLSKFAAALYDTETDEEERGVIINTASTAAFEGQIGQIPYAASKGGIASLTLPAARELARHRIRVVTIAPGPFLTPLMQSIPEELQAELGRNIPFPSRLGDPDEYARLVEAIITNPMLNGETIRLDGALRMPPK